METRYKLVNVIVEMRIGARIVSVILFHFIFLSRESEGGAIFWTNPHPLRCCPSQVFLLIFWLPPS